jgi:hypothetical protein
MQSPLCGGPVLPAMAVPGCCPSCLAVQVTVELYRAVVQELLPTPTKSHYLFNTRDLARIIQGTTRASKSFFDTKESMLALWVRSSLAVPAMGPRTQLVSQRGAHRRPGPAAHSGP